MAEKSRLNTWMPVDITPGLFPSERTIRFKGADGEEISVFVSTTQVDEAKRALKITVLDQDSEYALVQIPSQSGTRVAKVSRSEIRSR
jgi:hypothetical protein